MKVYPTTCIKGFGYSVVNHWPMDGRLKGSIKIKCIFSFWPFWKTFFTNRPQGNLFYIWTQAQGASCDRTTSGRGSSTSISLSDSRRSENTINTHKYNTIYCSSSRSYYNLGSCISYTERGLKPKLRFKKCQPSVLYAWGSLYGVQPSSVWTSHWQPSSASPKRGSSSSPAHRKNYMSKAWATTLSKTYPWWPKNHH
jgi:hypothetical protein